MFTLKTSFSKSILSKNSLFFQSKLLLFHLFPHQNSWINDCCVFSEAMKTEDFKQFFCLTSFFSSSSYFALLTSTSSHQIRAWQRTSVLESFLTVSSPLTSSFSWWQSKTQFLFQDQSQWEKMAKSWIIITLIGENGGVYSENQQGLLKEQFCLKVFKSKK